MSENPISNQNIDAKLCSLSIKRAYHRFTLEEIQLATQNFDDNLVIGKGGFGKVYKGHIYGTRDSTESVVAIKRLNSGSMQGAAEFMTEIEMLSKVRHCNLVSLIGYCYNNDEMILVYEYMANGTIEHHLHEAHTPLSWMERIRISIGAAQGLQYLHTGVHTQKEIIHRDVKSSNILLDENWAAKISDFGLSKIISQPSSGVITNLKGTFGYLDPEYCNTGKLTKESDVFSFGVILFELLSGKRAVDTPFKEEGLNLAGWAIKCIEDRQLEQIVDSHITTQIDPRCLKGFVQIANQCIKSSRKERPTMAEVVAALHKSMALQIQFDSSAQARRSTGLRIFSYSDMERATRNFSGNMLLGRGNYGEVFRGWLDKKTYSPSESDSGLPIAVKRLYAYKFKSHMVKELKMKSSEEINDLNVVKILGYCMEKHSILIVYEFMHQGTLNDYLFCGKRTEQHLLISRVKIAIGVARGLLFLRTHPQLADCSLQMHNILLDKEFNAKLSDFDVEMLVRSCDAFFDLLPSSLDYLKVRSGVFGFGVLMMELLTGKPISNESDLMVTRRWMPSICGALDNRMILNFLQRRLAVRLVELAKKCVAYGVESRPTLELVLEELEEIYAVILKSYNSSRLDRLSMSMLSSNSF